MCVCVCLSVSVPAAAILPPPHPTPPVKTEKIFKFFKFFRIIMQFLLQNTIIICRMEVGESPCRSTSVPYLAGCSRELGTEYKRNTIRRKEC
jgi:hypothetical protein